MAREVFAGRSSIREHGELSDGAAIEGIVCLSQFSPPPITNPSNLSVFVSSTHFKPVVPVGVLLRNEDEGVIGGVTGGVRLPLAWRGGVAVLFRDTVPVMDRDSLGVAFFFMVSCSRRAASVMNLMTRKAGRWWTSEKPTS